MSIPEYTPSKTVLQSYAHHEKGVIFVSTIERDYDTMQGVTRGLETMVWEWDVLAKKRIDGHIGPMGGLVDHQRICRCWIAEGEMLDEHNEKHERFFK